MRWLHARCVPVAEAATRAQRSLATTRGCHPLRRPVPGDLGRAFCFAPFDGKLALAEARSVKCCPEAFLTRSG